MSLNAIDSDVTAGEMAYRVQRRHLAARVHVERRRPGLDDQDVVPAVAREIPRVVHHGRRVFLGRVERLAEIELVRILERRAQVKPVPHRHIEHAIVIEIAGRDRPAVVEILEVLGAKTR